VRPSDAPKLAQLAEPLRSRLTALLTATGDKVWIVSGRRTIEEQIALRRAHCGSSWEAIYTAPASSCSPPTARPGSSKHEVGLAADLGGDTGLAGTLARTSGLHRPVTGEAWHFEADPAALGYLSNDIPGPLDDAMAGLAGFDLPGQGVVEDAVGSVLGKLVEPFTKGLARIALVTVLVLGGVGLVTLGGLRSSGARGLPVPGGGGQ
jgi:hypothetical protein